MLEGFLGMQWYSCVVVIVLNQVVLLLGRHCDQWSCTERTSTWTVTTHRLTSLKASQTHLWFTLIFPESLYFNSVWQLLRKHTWYDFTQQLSVHTSDDAKKKILSLNQQRTRLAIPEPSSQNLTRGMPLSVRSKAKTQLWQHSLPVYIPPPLVIGTTHRNSEDSITYAVSLHSELYYST